MALEQRAFCSSLSGHAFVELCSSRSTQAVFAAERTPHHQAFGARCNAQRNAARGESAFVGQTVAVLMLTVQKGSGECCRRGRGQLLFGENVCLRLLPSVSANGMAWIAEQVWVTVLYTTMFSFKFFKFNEQIINGCVKSYVCQFYCFFYYAYKNLIKECIL